MTNFEPAPGQPQQPSSTGSAMNPAGSTVAGMFSEQMLNDTKAGVQKLVESANSKGFAINEEGADAYLRAFRNFEAKLADIQLSVHAASQAPKLGTSPYAIEVANHMKSMATGDHQSFDAVLQALTIVVQQAQVAFEQAKKNYAEMEDEAVQTFKGLID